MANSISFSGPSTIQSRPAASAPEASAAASRRARATTCNRTKCGRSRSRRSRSRSEKSRRLRSNGNVFLTSGVDEILRTELMLNLPEAEIVRVDLELVEFARTDEVGELRGARSGPAKRMPLRNAP